MTNASLKASISEGTNTEASWRAERTIRWKPSMKNRWILMLLQAFKPSIMSWSRHELGSMPSKMPNPKGLNGMTAGSQDFFCRELFFGVPDGTVRTPTPRTWVRVQMATISLQKFCLVKGAKGMRSVKPSRTCRFGIPNRRSLDTSNSPAFGLINNVGTALTNTSLESIWASVAPKKLHIYIQSTCSMRIQNKISNNSKAKQEEKCRD